MPQTVTVVENTGSANPNAVSADNEFGTNEAILVSDGTIRKAKATDNFVTSTASVFNESGADVDFRVEGDTATHALVVDAGTNQVLIGTTVSGAIARFGASLIDINNAGSNLGSADIIIRGQASTALVFVDASRDAFTVGISSAATGEIADFAPTLINFNRTNADIDFTVEGTTATLLFHVDAGANGVYIGTTGLGEIAYFRPADCVFNEAGADRDFRIEGDTLTHAFYIDAAAASENIALLASSVPNWQSMDRGIFIGDATTAPTGNPTGGVFVWSESGELKARDGSGVVTTLTDANTGGFVEGPLTSVWDFSTTTTEADPGSGVFRMNNSSILSITEIYIDNADFLAIDWVDLLTDAFPTANVGIKGFIRVAHRDDTNEYINFEIQSISFETGYIKLSVLAAGASSVSVPSNGQECILSFAAAPTEPSTSGAKKYNIQYFTAGGTWTKPAAADAAGKTYVSNIGGGGGGGAGRRGAAGTVRGGGGGGGGGEYAYEEFNTSSVGSTETVTIGAGGAGAATQGTNDTNGASGSSGGDTTFGAHLTAHGGGGGGGGSTSAGTGGSGGTGTTSTIQQNGAAGGAGGGSAAAGNGGDVANSLAGAGGGGGAGLTSGNALAAAGSGGTSGGSGGSFGLTIFSATAGNLACTNGEPGQGGPLNVAVTQALLAGGGGGGGGQGSIAPNTAAALQQGFGGKGGRFGGGGGGGQSHLNSSGVSAFGGNGNSGLCVVVTELE